MGPSVEVEVVVIETAGDRARDIPIHEMGGRGVFVKEVQAAVLDGRADIAVHSAKDLQSSPTPGLVIAAVPTREDPRDALVGATLDGLAVGARVATGSVRRRAQVAAARPDLTFVGLRGNVDTRLRKAAEVGAIVVALAALRRLGYEDRVAEPLSPSIVLPQVAQGALAVECRSDDEEGRERLAAIDHSPSRLAVEAERAFLAQLGSGCDLPVGALYADGRLTGMMATLDGRIVLRDSVEGDDPEALGRELAERLLVGAGGSALLEDIGAIRGAVPSA